MLARIFNDENEPFWRSAKQMELGVIAPPLFRGYIEAQFERTGRRVDAAVVDRVLEATLGPPLRDAGALLLPLGRDARRGRGGCRAIRGRAREASPRRACPLRPRVGEVRARAAARPAARSRRSPAGRSSGSTGTDMASRARRRSSVPSTRSSETSSSRRTSEASTESRSRFSRSGCYEASSEPGAP